MVLIALSITFAGLGAMSLTSADSENSDDTEAAGPTTTSVVPQVPARTTTGAAAGTTGGSVTATSTPGAAAESTTDTTSTTASPSASGVDRATPVRILNNSTVAGLAADTASELAGRGWTNTSTGNYAGSIIPNTTVYYGSEPGEREAAEAVAADLGATTAPKIPGLSDGTGVVVVVTGR